MKINTIASNLKNERETRQLSQTELSKFTGITQQAISLWEKGERAPNITYCIILADFYGISLDELVGRDFPNNDRIFNDIHHNNSVTINQK